MKYILTTITLFFSLLAAGQIWFTPVDTIVPGTRDTVPIQAVIVCPGMETPRFKNIYREVVWDFSDRDAPGIYFIHRYRSWQFVKYLDEYLDSLTCILVWSQDLPRPPKAYPATKRPMPFFHEIYDTIYSRHSGRVDTGWFASIKTYPHWNISDTTPIIRRPPKFKAHAVLVASYTVPHRVEMIKNCEVEEIMVNEHRLWKIDGYRRMWPILIMRKGSNRWELVGW